VFSTVGNNFQIKTSEARQQILLVLMRIKKENKSFGGLECIGHFFAYVVHFLFLGYAWIRTQRAAVATYLPDILIFHFAKNLVGSGLGSATAELQQ
jgi:hypothetical protein